MALELAAAQGGEFYQSQRNEAGRQMTPDQIAQAKALAAAWKPKVAAVPGVKAKDQLGYAAVVKVPLRS